MKLMFVNILLPFILLFSCSNKKEHTTSKSSLQTIEVSKMKNDSLVLKKYVGGDPFMQKIDAEMKLAKNWGFIIQYTFGDCVGANDELIKTYKEHNKPVLDALHNKFGKNWETLFYNEVIFTTHKWYVAIETEQELLKTKKLNLTNESNQASITFYPNRTFIFIVKSGKEIKGNYTITENIIYFKFKDGNRIKYKYTITNGFAPIIKLIHN